MNFRIMNEGYDSVVSERYVSSASKHLVKRESGKTFIDLGMAGGSAILGHSHPEIRKAVETQLKLGSLFTQPNRLAHEYCKIISPALGDLSNIVFCSTGSEATMRAIRIARACTGRNKIGIFAGGWHGSHDFLLVEEQLSSPANKPRPKLKSAGTPAALLEDILFLPYNNDAALGLISRHAEDLAMVFIEPVQGSNPQEDIGPFLQKLRSVCSEQNILLGFDEIITGGRLSLAGGKDFFNVSPDISTYGKIYGGGLPLGLVAGTDTVMNCIRAKNPVFLGGTFSANPLSLAAGATTLSILKSEPEIYETLDNAGTRIADELNDFCLARGIDGQVSRCSSMFRFIFTSKNVTDRRNRDTLEASEIVQRRFYNTLEENGLSTGTNRINFLSTFHDASVLDKVIVAFKKTIEKELLTSRKKGLGAVSAG